MKVLVTGAAGFLGRHVVAALVRRGHRVRALVRTASVPQWWAESDVQVIQADLCKDDLGEACDGVEVIVHLAAQRRGSDEERIRGTTVATDRLLTAMSQANVGHLVLASSMAVYDWSGRSDTLSEETPLEAIPEGRDGYAIAKLQQEGLVRRFAGEHDLELTVLRPGYIWGHGQSHTPGVVAKVGPIRITIAPGGVLPLTYVENCADAFALAAGGKDNNTVNIVDSEAITARRLVREFCRQSHVRCIALPLPYGLGLAAAHVVSACATRLGVGRRLPGVLIPPRYRARFRPMAFPNAHACRVLGWTPRYGFAEAVQRSGRDQSAFAESPASA